MFSIAIESQYAIKAWPVNQKHQSSQKTKHVWNVIRTRSFCCPGMVVVSGTIHQTDTKTKIGPKSVNKYGTTWQNENKLDLIKPAAYEKSLNGMSSFGVWVAFLKQPTLPGKAPQTKKKKKQDWKSFQSLPASIIIVYCIGSNMG
jgi:hypothetical protein